MNKAAFKRKLWDEHLARIEANGGKKPPHVKMTPEEARARHLERCRRWKADNTEHVAEYNAAYRARRRAEMTPEEAAAERDATNAYWRERYATDAAYRERKNRRVKERRAWLKENDSEGYAELLRKNRESQARSRAKKKAAR